LAIGKLRLILLPLAPEILAIVAAVGPVFLPVVATADAAVLPVGPPIGAVGLTLRTLGRVHLRLSLYLRLLLALRALFLTLGADSLARFAGYAFHLPLEPRAAATALLRVCSDRNQRGDRQQCSNQFPHFVPPRAGVVPDLSTGKLCIIRGEVKLNVSVSRAKGFGFRASMQARRPRRRGDQCRGVRPLG
jgi:hypothetical protein